MAKVKTYYIKNGQFGKIDGPMEIEEVNELLFERNKDNDLFVSPNRKKWIKARELKGLDHERGGKSFEFTESYFEKGQKTKSIIFAIIFVLLFFGVLIFVPFKDILALFGIN